MSNDKENSKEVFKERLTTAEFARLPWTIQQFYMRFCGHNDVHYVLDPTTKSPPAISNGEKQKEEKPTIQDVLDYLHKNVSASIVYDDFHDFSKGIKGAEVDYFPEKEAELLLEMAYNHPPPYH